MKRPELRNIKNLEELEAARQKVGRELRRQRKALGRDVDRVRFIFKPMNLLGAGWHVMAPKARPLESFLLGLVRGAKSILRKI